ncbi:MAG: prephenate dehydrogenase/arogenate dehydrogenase family protein [Burkholderiaceae bacterium]|jgi:prephenate dehydrogenase|nr:prephenate dehydrogenase/arogenate dehydrogenase family protein [Burkholderiaceae bacterium]
MFEQLGVIGCGLMGGSFALAVRRAGLVKRVVGYSKSPTTTQRALQLGVIDAEAPSMLRAISGSDLVLIAVPVAVTATVFQSIQHLHVRDALVMDVGSTKRDVADAARRILGQNAAQFVPAHPIAGREVSGVDNADPDLYAGKRVVLTPLENTLPSQVRRAAELWQSIGSRVSCMTPEAHDAALAAVSHFPHLAAFALMLSLIEQPEGKAFLDLAGPGFRDFTRIAAAEPHMWRDVLIANQQQVRHQSRQFRKALVTLEHHMTQARAEDLLRLIDQASAARAAWQPASETTRPAAPVVARPRRDDDDDAPRSRFSLSSFFGTGL